MPLSIDETIIQAYLQDTLLPKDYASFQQAITLQKNRKEIVQELLKQLKDIIHIFPIYNPILFQKSFQEQLQQTPIIIQPLVNSDQLVKCHTDQNLRIQIDFIQVANCTRIVSQMHYILCNLLTLHIASYFIKETYLTQANDYLSTLTYLILKDGYANYLAWNQDCANYPFANEKYQSAFKMSSAFIQQAIEIKDIKKQNTIIEYFIQITDPFKNYALLCGMQQFHQAYQSNKLNGVLNLYKQGLKNDI